MTRGEYSRLVLAQLRRLTPEERAAVEQELAEHMEDHICDLRELGCDEALAEARTMEHMGDPSEVGRALARQYPLGWLVLGRAAAAVTGVLLAVALLGSGMLSHLAWSLEARYTPGVEWREDFRPRHEAAVDVRLPVGNDVVKVSRVAVGAREEHPEETVAALKLSTYDRLPSGIVAEGLLESLTVTNGRGETFRSYGSAENWSAAYGTCYVAVEPGETSVTLTCRRFGEVRSAEIPLPEVTP